MAKETVWRQKNIDMNQARDLQLALGCSELLALILAGRKINQADAAQQFLSPSLKQLEDPDRFADMKKAVERIVTAIDDNSVIGIFGDYDVDGVCSTALLQDFFSQLGASVVSTLPHRMSEGYGLSKAGVDRLKAQGAKLLITADCGILAHEQIAYARACGLDVIVVDHHTVGETLPAAVAVINPKRNDCSSHADHLCAAGVSFYLCAALRRALRMRDYFANRTEPDLKLLLDLVALATVCDVVPLVKDNRVMVAAGLQIIKAERRVGLRALIDVCGVTIEKISASNLGFHLGPRINAAGRLEHATSALELLLCSDADNAQHLAQQLDQTNHDRKTVENETIEHAVQLIESHPDAHNWAAIVLYDESWHPGVVGIVASRIAERYHKPAIIIGEKGKGSGRSIKGIDLHAMVSLAQSHLSGFGGHAHAIGVSLAGDSVDAFRRELCAHIAERISDSVFSKEIVYDAEIAIGSVNAQLIDELSVLDPFGASNPYPVLRINNCFVRNLRRLHGGHCKGELESHDGALSFIAFRMEMSDELANQTIDVLGVLEKNEWQGRISNQFRLVDYKKAPEDQRLAHKTNY